MNPQDQNPQALPELPEPRCLGWSGDRYDAYQIMGYDEEDLEAYARAAIALATQEPQRAEPAQLMREFIADIAKQTPEKPDYWSSCGQCSSNTSRAEDILDALATRKDVSPPPEPAT